MKISEKLKFIKDFSGLTQEKLAQKFGVSFATLNSWINDKSSPRQKNYKTIDELYLKYTGQTIVPKNILEAKKQILLAKKKQYKDVLKIIMENPDIYESFILALTYHTNRIEGNSLTEQETSSILFENKSLPGKNFIEQLEAKNHQTALIYLFDYILKKKKIDEKFILKMHGMLMNGIRQDAGTYRRQGVRILGSNIATANYLKIPILIKKLVRDISLNKKDFIKQVSLIHSRFEKIHPFSDGNGRIGRLLLHAMLLRKNFSPAIIDQKDRSLYIKYLNKHQKEEDSTLLEKFLCEAVLRGFQIIERK